MIASSCSSGWFSTTRAGWAVPPSFWSTLTSDPGQGEAVWSGVLLPTACCLLSAASCPLPTAHCLLPCAAVQSFTASTSQCWRIKQNHWPWCKWFNTVCHENSCLDSEKIISNVDSILLLLDQAWSWGPVCQQQSPLHRELDGGRGAANYKQSRKKI